ncbi:uncharacterized protein LOC131935115 [Physella acuta]|uniref:uncharacterized protein LOC131935115 n=1 Tax=Physella acuta TaxID=109671 RepID=UPI0027DB95D3|nr:uncharacterized protein LOC131935115 [Physella acuta]
MFIESSKNFLLKDNNFLKRKIREMDTYSQKISFPHNGNVKDDEKDLVEGENSSPIHTKSGIRQNGLHKLDDRKYIEAFVHGGFDSYVENGLEFQHNKFLQNGRTAMDVLNGKRVAKQAWGDHRDSGSVCSSDEATANTQLQDIPGGFRAKPNTPASIYQPNRNIKPSSRVDGWEDPERMIQSVSSGLSVRDDVMTHDRQMIFDSSLSGYYLVTQDKPAPMEPLQVWRGYKGNVYFQPIVIKKLNSAPSRPSTYNQKHSSRPVIQPRSASSGPVTHASGSTTKPYRYINSSPQVYVLDKEAVISSYSDKMHEELRSIEKIESTGSLAVRPISHSFITPRGKQIQNMRDRICKGSNFHTSKPNNLKNNDNRKFLSAQVSNRKQFFLGSAPKRRPNAAAVKQDANLVVNGDKFSPAPVVSPQFKNSPYSSSVQRATMNTPDSHASYDRLPTLEEVSSGLQKVEVSENLLHQDEPHSESLNQITHSGDNKTLTR